MLDRVANMGNRARNVFSSAVGAVRDRLGAGSRRRDAASAAATSTSNSPPRG